MDNGGAPSRSSLDLRNREAERPAVAPNRVWASFAAPAERRYSEFMKGEVEKQPGSVSTLQIAVPEDQEIPGQRPGTNVAASEVEVAIERLRDQTADFVDVPERGLEMGDFAVIDFEGSSNGKPISEIAPQASKNLQGGKKFWLHLASDNFLPKFCEQMLGQKPGEPRTVPVDFAVDL